MRKLFVAPVVVFTAIVLSGTAAFAHECYNTKRSAKGNAGAAQSNAWGTVTLADVFADAVANSEEFGLPPADAANIADMIEDAVDRGVPESFTIHFPSTAASGVYGTYHSSDGKGIDHFFATFEGDLVNADLCGAGAGDCID